MIYERLPGSLKLEESNTESVIQEGFVLTPLINSFKIGSGVIAWSFGFLSVGEVPFTAEVAEGEYLVGITASPLSGTQEISQESVTPDLDLVTISGDFLPEGTRPENLYLPDNFWRPGFAGAELILRTEGSITKVSLTTSTSVEYDEVVYNPVDDIVEIENISDNSKIVIKVNSEDAEVSKLLISGSFEEELPSIQFSYFLQPVGRSLSYEPLKETRNLYLLRYSYTRGWIIEKDLRVFGLEGEVDLARILIKNYDERLDSLYQLAENYPERYMNYDTAFKGEY